MLKFTSASNKLRLYISETPKPTRIERTHVGTERECTDMYFLVPGDSWGLRSGDPFGSRISVMESAEQVHDAYFPPTER